MAKTPIIPNLEAHIREKINEIMNMDASASRQYDTPITWAFIKMFYPHA